MRVVRRNRRPVAYAYYLGKTEVMDADGNYTGDTEEHYSEPVKALMNVSGGRGAADVAMFGFDSAYSRSIVTEDLTTPFNTDTVFWIENDPDNEPHDYRVVGVSRTVNQVVIALTEVHINNGEADAP